MNDDHDEQVEIYYADRNNLQKTYNSVEPRWLKLPQPHTLCSNTTLARSTIEQLKRFNADYSNKMFKVVRVRDDVETFNEWTSD